MCGDYDRADKLDRGPSFGGRPSYPGSVLGGVQVSVFAGFLLGVVAG
uniref:Uncharacterized protein n=1 Tax=Siphoviridae sp. ctXOZ1 TaxID=2823585 RepID=A0A8S5LBC1_9CAUD|nr:MAG TPA: hypothetical protein [Siphoviridae sp. ctXOZ1]